MLSACETSAGPAVDGEGVVALSRGFHAAGRARGEAAGPDYAAALREAKLGVRRQPVWAHPYYWPAFVLTGPR